MKILVIIILFCSTFLYSEEKLSPNEISNLVKVEIIPESQYLKNNDSVLIAFKFTIKDHWHIYWINSGDSGLPTEVSIDYINGLVQRPLEFPVPDKIPFSGYYNFGYEKQVVLFQRLYFPEISNSKLMIIPFNIKWLVCKENCIPQDTTIEAKFVISNEKVSNHKWSLNRLNELYAEIPKPSSLFNIKAIKNSNEVTIDFNSKSNPKVDYSNLEFLSYDASTYVFNPNTKAEKKVNGYQIKLELDKFRAEDPKRLRGILIGKKGQFGKSKSSAIEINQEFEK